MNIIPAIDLKDKKCVRLYKGDFEKQTIYCDNPIEMAMRFKSQGARALHIVDLDGAKNANNSQITLIKEIYEQTRLEVHIGGGIREEKQLQDIFGFGIKRVIVGSLALQNPKLIQKWIKQFGNEKIILAFDIKMQNIKMKNIAPQDKMPMIALNAWQETSNISLWQILDEYSDAKYILCTDIDRDGTLEGPNFALYEHISKKYPHLHLIASGGVSSLEDLRSLKTQNIHSAIVGKALYEHKFTLRQALKC